MGKKLIKHMIRELLGNKQVCEFKSGAEGMVLTGRMIREWIKRNPEYCGYQLDWENCFNKMDDEKLLDAVREEAPILYPLAYQLYGKATIMITDDGIKIVFESGERQGHVLSTIFLGIVQKRFYRFIEQKCIEDDPNFEEKSEGQYVDDNQGCATFHHANIKIKNIIKYGPDWGFHLNKGKSNLIIAGAKQQIHHLLSENLSEFVIKENANFECLNVPIGDNEFVLNKMTVLVEELFLEIDKIHSINDVHIQLKIMKEYINISHLIYWFRNLSPRMSQGIAHKYDLKLRGCINEMFGWMLNDTQFMQSSLSAKRDGFGLRTASNKISAINLPAIHAAMEISRNLVDSQLFDQYKHVIQQQIDWCISDYNSRVFDRHKIYEFDPNKHTTSWMIKNIENKHVNQIAHSKTGKDKAIFISGLNKNANAWLNLSLKKGYGVRFTNAEIRLLAKRKLRQKLSINNEECMECGEVLDKYGDKAVVCKYGTGLIYRHDLLVLTISSLLKQANVMHDVELRHLFNNNAMKPADIFVKNWGNDGQCVAFDIGITSVTRDSIVDKSSNKLLAAANDFYLHKHSKYKRYIENNNININQVEYSPLIIEDQGGFHKGFVYFIKKMAKLRAANLNIDEPTSIAYCFSKISASLQKANAICLLNHYYAYSSQEFEHKY